MTPSPSSAAEHVVEALAGSKAKAALALAEALESGELTLRSSSVAIANVRGVDQRSATVFARAFGRLVDITTADAVALAIRSATVVVENRAGKQPTIQVAWTGPDAGGAVVRGTGAILKEMVRGAQAGGEILLVGYSLTASGESPSTEVIALLGEASRNQVALTVVLHKDEQEANRANLLQNWDVFAVKPRVYTWEPSAGGPYTKLHAKVLVVDRRDVLVTSANLTYHGLTDNIEIGLRVQGPQAAAIASRFDHLIAERVLKIWKPAT
ncbi:MAG TPA: phospholipase D-like domain-containing protein [Baekduia sp.]|nr:phospholipase D-like domain-containing protein [Baekduia sp.]